MFLAGELSSPGRDRVAWSWGACATTPANRDTRQAGRTAWQWHRNGSSHHGATFTRFRSEPTWVGWGQCDESGAMRPRLAPTAGCALGGPDGLVGEEGQAVTDGPRAERDLGPRFEVLAPELAEPARPA